MEGTASSSSWKCKTLQSIRILLTRLDSAIRTRTPCSVSSSPIHHGGRPPRRIESSTNNPVVMRHRTSSNSSRTTAMLPISAWTYLLVLLVSSSYRWSPASIPVVVVVVRGLENTPPSTRTTRRQVIGQSIQAVSAGGLLLNSAGMPKAAFASSGQDDTTATGVDGAPFSFQTYQVVPDASAALNPRLQELKSSSFLDRLAAMRPGGAVWLGEHHSSAPDHVLQANMLKSLQARRPAHLPLALGLEQIQIQFQPVLDDYSAGRLTTNELRRLVQWDQRWTWPFEVYEPIFRLAKDLGVALIALNVNSEDLEYVERSGFPGLPPDRMRQYIGDPSGFAAFARPHQFSSYVDYVIAPSYQLHQDMGLLQRTMSGVKLDETMSFRKFLSGRMLWDEAMAWRSYMWTSQNPGGLLVGLVGADHVKFRHGIPGRFVRLAKGTSDCVSVLLNPTLIDSRPSNSIATSPEELTSRRPDQITLQLRYVDPDDATVGVLPLADYLVLG